MNVRLKSFFVGLGVCAALLISAVVGHAIPPNSPSKYSLQQDASTTPIQSPPGEQMTDSAIGPISITTLQVVSTNVGVYTTATAHGFSVGQTVTVTGCTLTEFNVTAVITTISSPTVFRCAVTHANEGPTADTTGTATAQNVSPIATGTTQISLKFPAGAIHLVVNPITANASIYGATGVTTSGTRTLYSNTANHINGVEGDTVYIDRSGNTTTLEFVFDKMR